MKAYVIMFNRLTWPKKLCADLTKAGLEVILIDNGSTYPPLLEWYNKREYEVFNSELNGANLGSKSPWISGIIDKFDDTHYIVTDHDLDISHLPKDWLKVLMNGFKAWDVTKSGLSLKLGDLPDNAYANEVKEYEDRFWQTPVNGYWSAPIDTTLAIYRRDRMQRVKFPFNLTDGSETVFYDAVRSPAEYAARHMPWYNTPENMTHEELYYINHIGNDGYWTQKYKVAHGID